MHFSFRSYNLRKAVANSAAVMDLRTRSQVGWKLCLVSVMPASCSFTFGNKKKSAGVRSGEYGGCWIIWIPWTAIHSLTTAAVCTGALS